MRNFKQPPGAGAKHQLLTGGPMPHPRHRLSSSARGAQSEDVIPLATAEGDVQAALSSGGAGVLRKAGRP